MLGGQAAPIHPCSHEVMASHHKDRYVAGSTIFFPVGRILFPQVFVLIDLQMHMTVLHTSNARSIMKLCCTHWVLIHYVGVPSVCELSILMDF